MLNTAIVGDQTKTQFIMGTAILLLVLIYFGFLFLMVASTWKVFVKAGKPGWACIIPIYSAIVMFEIVGKPLWWIVLLFVPIANFVVIVILCIELAKSFGKDSGYGIGILFLSPIFIPMLAFGDSVYVGPGGVPGGAKIKVINND
jgi:membrane-associated HD superfamily phosphohydrolase